MVPGRGRHRALDTGNWQSMQKPNPARGLLSKTNATISRDAEESDNGAKIERSLSPPERVELREGDLRHNSEHNKGGGQGAFPTTWKDATCRAIGGKNGNLK